MKKAEALLRTVSKTFHKKKERLSQEGKEKIYSLLQNLREAILNRDSEKTKEYSSELEKAAKIYLKKSAWEKVFEFSFAMIVALFIAIVIRQMAFELYEIPTGSMRPTFKEKDRLIVSKSQFGLNVPLTTSHFLFKSKEVKRMGVVTFTGENLDIPNVKTRYFYLFPGYRQYVKRVVGLPGDTLYFYGGKVYGIDRHGVDITGDLIRKELDYLEHIPFIHIEGKAIYPKTTAGESYSSILFKQMNIPLAKLTLTSEQDVDYEMILNPKFEKGHQTREFDFYDLWGMKNFANARILPKKMLEENGIHVESPPNTEYYLELTHHASVKKSGVVKDSFYRLRPVLHTDKSYIPLSEKAIKRIWDNLYTGRFIVQNGQFRRLGLSDKEVRNASHLPRFRHETIPDGTYEFYYGKVQEVKAEGLLYDLKPDHPLANFSVQKCVFLFNIGIECDSRFLPSPYGDRGFLPGRYAYFRDGDFYLMGAPIFQKGEDVLEDYVKRELARKESSASYEPFIDWGPPLNKDGTLNVNFIKTYGLKIPDKQYLCLGDNHAMSGDSRDFGFVPEGNLRGVPAFIFWAPGGRYGFNTPDVYNWITLPKVIVWSILLGGTGVYLYYSRRRPLELIIDPAL